jgi:sRNA-binding protein
MVSMSGTRTPAVEAGRRPNRRLARDQAIDWLAAAYPATFGPDVRPLAPGVGKLIWPEAKAAGINRQSFNVAIGRRVKSPAYLRALAADGALRIGLDGAAIEPVSEEHQVNALDCLAEIERRLGVNRHQQESA